MTKTLSLGRKNKVSIKDLKRRGRVELISDDLIVIFKKSSKGICLDFYEVEVK